MWLRGAVNLADDVSRRALTLVLSFVLPVMPGRARRCRRREEREGSQWRNARVRVGDDRLHGGDGEALGDAGSACRLFVFASGEGDLLDDLADVVGDLDAFGGGRPVLSLLRPIQASWAGMVRLSSMFSG